MTKGNKNIFCPVYKRCSGCHLQNLSYSEQLAMKAAKIKRLLGQFGPVCPIIGMDNPYNYRHKVQSAFALNRKRQIVSGVYKSSTRSVVPIDFCGIENKKASEIVVTVRKLMKSFKIEPYDTRTKYGFLRHVLIRTGFNTEDIMVVLVSAAPVFPSKNSFVKALLKEHPEITTVIHNISKSEKMTLGEREHVLYGKGYIEDILCGFRFRISARSFYQVNPSQTELLYKKAIELARLNKNDTVLDAYCGTGTIGICLSGMVKSVTGVELNKEAVRDAIENARLSGVTNTKFFQGDAGQFMVRAVREGRSFDVVFTDPPRAGCDTGFLDALIKMRPAKIVYISCNPETQVRDVDYLTDALYLVKSIQPVDMFPHTNHIENICVLEDGLLSVKSKGE